MIYNMFTSMNESFIIHVLLKPHIMLTFLPHFFPPFRFRPLRIITLIFSLNLFISALVFCGLNLSGANYSADPFVYTMLGGLMEVPGYSLTAPLINRVGRKWPTIWGYLISGVTIFLLAFIPSGM